jgi:membrane protein implicated in regulation of membrane protease activity
MDPLLEPYMLWAIAGLVLAIVEIFSGTFYLVMLGIAAFGGAVAAYFGLGFPAQSLVAAALAAAGCYGVYEHRVRNAARRMAPVDAGQRASFEQWIDRRARLARVQYRGASWEARVTGDDALDTGAVLYVQDTRGNTLDVSTQRPA